MKESFIKRLITLLEKSDLESLQISTFWGMKKIKLFKSSIPREITDKNTYVDKKVVNEESIPIESIKNNSISDNLDLTTSSSDTTTKVGDKHTERSKSESSHIITAPLVGTFYMALKPGDPPFIKVGDKINIGQTLCIIEAMKIFNEIEAEVSGVVEEILVENSSPVEFSQPIISVNTNDSKTFNC